MSLAEIPSRLERALGKAESGVIVLAVDGLSSDVAKQSWLSASVSTLSSTVPSTTATALLTALTGVPADVHRVPGTVYRNGSGLVHAVNGTPPIPDLPTVLERHGATALARELDHLEGTWAQALLRGTNRVPAAAPHKLAAQAEDPPLLVANVVVDLDKALKDARFLWTYVNISDHVHRHGYDESVHEAMLRLDAHANRWAAAGWTVIAYSDHGMIAVDPDPELVEAWDAIVREECVIPSGGAGRMRWLYPKADRLEAVFDRVATTLGDAATVHHATDLGLPQPEAGPVVAVAASPRFPLPDPSVKFEHGGLSRDEIDVPFAVWQAVQ
ncbi:alkaline phosphatase family protein [Lentzea sp. JNUCC 0626]|uniref:alkaline phosphatase family protein n=1 Tax=Lentzea sp. JNUCC 0626 TaxID=3367513 RepID=UPI003747AEEA